MDGVNPSPRAGEDRCLSSSSQVGSKRQESLLPPSFCSIQTFNGLNDAHPHCSELSIFLSLLMQMLISSVPHRHTQK